MADLGLRKFQDLIGRTDLLKVRNDIIIEKAKTLKLDNILRNALELRPGVNIQGGSIKQDFQLENRLDNCVIELITDVLNGKQNRVDIELNINNECRAFAATLSYHISKYVSSLVFYYIFIFFFNFFLNMFKHILSMINYFSFYFCINRLYGENGLPEGSINIKMKGSAGQSFCAFMTKGVHVTLEGDANDYVAKVSFLNLIIQKKKEIINSLFIIYIFIIFRVYVEEKLLYIHQRTVLLIPIQM